MSAMRKRTNGLVFKGLNNGSVVTVRNEFRFCRKCGVGRMAFPRHIVFRLNVRALFMDGTSNNVGPGFRVNSLVIVSSRVGFFPRRPLHNGGFPANPHFPSVRRTCSGRLHGLTSRVTGRGSVPIRRNMCINIRNPAFRAPTRCHVCQVLNNSTMNVDAIPRMVITHRYNVGMFNVDVVASLNNFSIPMRMDRRRMRVTTGTTRPGVARVVQRVVHESWLLVVGCGLS